MRVKDLMKRDVTTIGVRESAGDALQRMRGKRIRHLVVMEKREIVGVLADRDLLGNNDRELASLPVGDIMTSDPATIEPDDPISKAANRMRGRGIGCLPVVEGGNLVGILTTTDLLEALTHGQAERRSIRDQRIQAAPEKPSPTSRTANRVTTQAPAIPRTARFARKHRRAPAVPRPR